ncbi:MAG: hypothetical protein ACE1ZS_06565, partial [Candidatus Poribacteria bacterium]
MTLDELLHLMIDKEASDLHLKVGRPPGMRIHGELVPLMEVGPISSDEMPTNGTLYNDADGNDIADPSEVLAAAAVVSVADID